MPTEENDNKVFGLIMRVLIACEFSGIVREAFRKRGHDAWSCDLLPTEQPGNHIQDDVLNHLNEGWDMMIGHPECTYLCFAGIRWNVGNPDRERKTVQAIVFFEKLLDAPINKICLENPVGVIPRRTRRKWAQIIHPWQFGHEEEKKTCLWLKNLPPLQPTRIMDKREQKVFYMAPSKDRSKKRSLTYTGIAEAMAIQWG